MAFFATGFRKNADGKGILIAYTADLARFRDDHAIDEVEDQLRDGPALALADRVEEFLKFGFQNPHRIAKIEHEKGLLSR